MLIAICGIDGSGKTTQIKMLSSFFEKKFPGQVFTTKQPTEFYRKYDRFRAYVNREINDNKEIIYELALLSAADKLRHYSMELFPNKDKIIISDRYVFSAYAYFLARGLSDVSWLSEINKFLPLPDITIYIDVSPETAYRRIINRDGGYTKKEETDMQVLGKVRQYYLEEPWGKNKNYHIISSEEKNIEAVHNEIIEIILAYMEGKE